MVYSVLTLIDALFIDVCMYIEKTIYRLKTDHLNILQIWGSRGAAAQSVTKKRMVMGSIAIRGDEIFI